MQQLNCHVLLGDPLLPDPIKNNGKFNPEDIETVKKLKDSLSELKEYNFTFIDNHKKLFSYLDSVDKPDLIFNLCDEGYNNDPKKELHIPAFLEMLNIPYTGSNPNCLAMCYNKSIINSFARFLKIKTPLETLIDSKTDLIDLKNSFPVLLKPALGDGSIGITQKAVCYNKKELLSYYEWLKYTFPNTPIIMQEFLEGREFSVAVLGNSSNYEALPILEVDYSNLPKNLPKILSYESKWVPESPYWDKISYKKALLTQKHQKDLIDNSKMLFDLLQCKDYARFDYRLDSQENIKFLEVNPNPGWCWDGKLNLMAGFANLSYSQLLDKILKSSIQRYNLKNN
jgi:D-alanine-D-alanine ligase